MDDIIVQGDIQFNRTTHTYIHLPTKKKLMSVSTIIKLIYNKKSWDGVDPEVVDNARERGIMVDYYLAKYIETGKIVMEDIREDVIERVSIAISLLEKHYGQRRKVEVQKIVYDVELGIAGTADIVIDDEEVVDLKSTWAPEVDWMLQIGGYAWLGKYSKTAILHVSPKFYKIVGVGGKRLKYNTTNAVSWWISAMNWWKLTKDLEDGFKEKKAFTT